VQLPHSLQFARTDEALKIRNNTFQQGNEQTETSEPAANVEFTCASSIEQAGPFNELEMATFDSSIAGTEVADKIDRSISSFRHPTKQKTV
jgi:hypothetical protein